MSDVDHVPACVDCAHYQDSRCVVHYPARRHPIYGWEVHDGSNSCRSMRKPPSRWWAHRCGLYGRFFVQKTGLSGR